MKKSVLSLKRRRCIIQIFRIIDVSSLQFGSVQFSMQLLPLSWREINVFYSLVEVGS